MRYLIGVGLLMLTGCSTVGYYSETGLRWGDQFNQSITDTALRAYK